MEAVERLRVLKAMQTSALRDKQALGAMKIEAGDDALSKELHDTIITAQHHIDALEHVIAAIMKPPANVES